MALLSIQSLPGGGSPTFAAATSGGDTIAGVGGRGAGWDLGVMLVLRNGGAAKTVTVEGMEAVTVTAGTTATDPALDLAGVTLVPIPKKHFGNALTITYSAVTDLAVAAVDLA